MSADYGAKLGVIGTKTRGVNTSAAAYGAKLGAMGAKTPAKTTRYSKPKPAPGLPKWFLDMRAGSEFMPAKVKPYSYNYMSLVESPNRQDVYAPGGWAGAGAGAGMGAGAAAGMNIGLNTRFNTPTEDVGKAIGTNYNLSRDQQNLGTEPPSRIMGFFQRAIDVMSRPLYAVGNIHLTNVKSDYMTPESAGGERVTFGEHVMAFLDTATPFGAIKDVTQGQFDDRIRAGWAGLSGKAKVTTHTVLEQEYPGFTKEHPKLAVGASILGDIAFDPITWLTMGMAGPATATKSLGAAAMGAVGRRSIAKNLIEETLLSRTGRDAAKEALRTDAFNAELRTLTRQQRRMDKGAAKAAEGKKTKLTEAEYNRRSQEIGNRIAGKAVEDIKGADFAWRTIKRGIPTLGINTVSRANLAASHWRKVAKSNELINTAKDDFIKGTVGTLGKEQRWHSIWAAMGGKEGKLEDFHYTTPNGQKHTVKLSEAKDFDDFLAKIVEEGSAIAKIQEGTVKAKRARKARIVATESRATSFAAAFEKYIKNNIGDALSPDAAKAFDKLRVRGDVVAAGGLALPSHLADVKLVNIKEDELDNMTFDELKTLAKETWEKNKTNKDAAWRDDPHVVVHREGEEPRLVRIRNLNNAVEQAGIARKERNAARLATDLRSAADKANDAAAGISDGTAAARARVIAAHNNLQAARQANAAKAQEALGQNYVGAVEKTEEARKLQQELQNLAPQEVKDIYNKILDTLGSSTQYTAAEKKAFLNILGDGSIPMAQRVALILSHMDISDNEVVNIVREIADFRFDQKLGTISASVKGEGSGVEMLQKIMNTVLEHRVTSRIGKIDADNIGEVSELLRAAGVRAVRDADGNVKIVKMDDASNKNPAFLRDLHSELGMAVLDAYRYAIQYMMKADMMKDPELAYKTISASVDNFISDKLAGIKRDVLNIMFNVTGVRLPEEFVPKLIEINNLFPPGKRPTYQWRNMPKKPGELGALGNQEIPWQNLAKDMQRWAVDDFHWLNPKNHKNGGIDIDDIKKQIEAERKKGLPTTDPDVIDRFNNLVGRVHALKAAKSPRAINDTTEVVNSYNYLDYILHGDQILKSQDMTLTVKNVSGGKVNRLNSGRLSALDSFNYVDDDVRKGLEALTKLKELTRDKNAEVAQMAKLAIADIFEDAGGLTHLDTLKADNLADIDFNSSFKSLGMHARLKEDVVSKGSMSLGTKQRADLMDSMWKTATLHHEWQKALHQAILHDTMVEGFPRATAAQRMGINIQNFFKDYENIKRLIHPVRRDGSALDAFQTRELSQKVQANRVNRFSGTPQDPTVTVPEVEFPYQVDVEGLKVSPNAKKFPQGPDRAKNVRDWLESVMPKAGMRGTAKMQQDIGHIRDTILSQSGHAQVYQVHDGKTAHGIIIEIPQKVERGIRTPGGKTRYLITKVEPNGPFVQYHSLSNRGSRLEDFSAVVNPNKEKRAGRLIQANENIPGASVNGKLNVIDPKSEFTQPGTAPVGTPEQHERVADLLEELKNVRNAEEAERNAKNAFDAGMANPASVGTRAIAEESEFARQRQIYINKLKNPDAPESAGDPADFANVSDDLTEYSSPEIDRIRAWIAQTYADKPPAQLAKEMHALSNSLTYDISEAQGQMIAYMRDWSLKNKANLRFMGVPLMNLPHAMNATHSEAGVTALAQSQSRAKKTLSSRMDPTLSEGKKRDLLVNYRRRSHVLNLGLDRMAAMYANPAAILRKEIIPALNTLYRGIHKGEYLDPAVGALGRRERFNLINKQLFDPAVQKVGDPLKRFDQKELDVDGLPYNPVKEIQRYFHEISARVWDPDYLDARQYPEYKRERLLTFNKFIIKKYRLTPEEVKKIHDVSVAGHPINSMQPYTMEWLREAAKVLGPGTNLSSEKLLNINLGEFHYAIHDAKLKIDAGDALHDGVWSEFSTTMSADHVKYINNKIVPQTIGVNGEPMRGKLIKISDIAEGPYSINKNYIPAKFLNGPHYIREDLLPEIRVLFDYMDQSHQLNDVINTGFFDKVMNYFKASVTIYNIPTYPVRNLMSDVFLGAMDGVINPRVYGDAAKIIYSQRQDMKNMQIRTYQDVLDDNFFKREMAAAQHDPDSVMDPMRNPNKPVTLRLQTRTGRVDLSDDQIYHLYEQLGLGQNRVSTDIPEVSSAARRKALHHQTGKVTDSIRTLNDVREDWGRMAHFLHALEKEAPLGGGIDQIARRAGDRVIKFHFDYSDVSLWERKYLAKYIPFYKWTKNIIPFTLANTVLNPKFINLERAISKTTANLINDDPEAKEDFIVADWIRHDVPVPIGTWTDPNGNAFQQFALMYLPLSGTLTETISPTLDPLFDAELSVGQRLLKTGGGAATTALSMTNPVIKAGYQAASEEVPWASGSAPQRPDQNWAKTLASVIPGYAPITSIGQGVGQLGSDSTTGKNQTAQLLDILGAANVYNNSEAAQLGQLKIMEDRGRANLNKRKAELTEQLRGKFPNAQDEGLAMLMDMIMKNTRQNDPYRV